MMRVDLQIFDNLPSEGNCRTRAHGLARGEWEVDPVESLVVGESGRPPVRLSGGVRRPAPDRDDENEVLGGMGEKNAGNEPNWDYVMPFEFRV
jgi:hypothetical protein